MEKLKLKFQTSIKKSVRIVSIKEICNRDFFDRYERFELFPFWEVISFLSQLRLLGMLSQNCMVWYLFESKCHCEDYYSAITVFCDKRNRRLSEAFKEILTQILHMNDHFSSFFFTTLFLPYSFYAVNLRWSHQSL